MSRKKAKAKFHEGDRLGDLTIDLFEDAFVRPHDGIGRGAVFAVHHLHRLIGNLRQQHHAE